MRATLQVLEALERESAGAVEAHVWPLWQRLAQDAFFIAKASAAALAADVHAALGAGPRAELRRVFASTVAQDECPIVRRAAVPALARLVGACQDAPRVLADELWPLFEALAADAQDSVRLLVLDVALAFGDCWPPADMQHRLLPVLLRLAGDRSWRVRYVVAGGFPSILTRIVGRLSEGGEGVKGVEGDGGDGAVGVSSVPVPVPVTDTVPVHVTVTVSPTLGFDPLALFTGLLADTEPEVRTAGARQVAATCAHFSQRDFEGRVLGVLRELAEDRAVPVRAALALQLNPLSAIAGADLCATALFPLYTRFFADESSQVRLNAVAKMDVVCRVLGLERLAQSILPAVVQLAQDRQWRVREAVIEHLPTLVGHLGAAFYDQHLGALCQRLLDDPVHAVRRAAAANVRALCEAFGLDWALWRIVQPALAGLGAAPCYLRRVGVAHLVATLLPCLRPAEPVHRDALLHHLLPALQGLAADPVPNVRLVCARTAALLAPFFPGAPELRKATAAMLLPLHDDADFDVQYYAKRAQAVMEC